MTMQMCDFVWYKGRRFVLIDCEKDKSIIGSADFNLSGRFTNTACHRGYTAEYYIDDNFLFGEKTVEKYETTDGAVKGHFEVSEKMKLGYTGSAVIAANYDNSFGCSDFIDCFLDYDLSFELYFANGELVEITDLFPIIQEWKSVIKDSGGKSYSEIYKQRREFAKKHLHYEYGCNYKFDGR